MDEAFLVLNILDKPFDALFGQLGFNQAAPPAFLLAERASIAVFGKGEYALRLFPLICAIASLLLFKRVAAALLERRAALLALALFSLSDGAVFYGSQAKQYSTDVAVTLLITAGGLDLRAQWHSRARATAWATVGAAAMWFSHAAAFAVVAVLALFVPDILRRSRDVLGRVAPVMGLWLVSLAAALAYEHSTTSGLLRSFSGQNAQSRFNGGGGAGTAFPTGLGFFRDALGGLADSVGVPTTSPGREARYVFAAVAVAGAAGLARRSPRALAVVGMPAVGVFAAAEIRAYPVLQRTILFLVPLVIVMLAEGVCAISRILPRWRAASMVVLSVAVVAVTGVTAAGHLVAPPGREEMKPVLGYLARQWRQGDSLFVFHRAQYALRYYLECDCFANSRVRRRVFPQLIVPGRLGPAQFAPALLSNPPRLVVAQQQDHLRAYVSAAAALRGRKHVWVLVTTVDPVERSLLAYLSCVGRRTGVYARRYGTADFRSVILYQYDFSSWRLVAGACDARFGL